MFQKLTRPCRRRIANMEAARRLVLRLYAGEVGVGLWGESCPPLVLETIPHIRSAGHMCTSDRSPFVVVDLTWLYSRSEVYEDIE